MGVFKTYDIRGVYGTEIDTDLGYRVGRALARFYGRRSYLLGYDARQHSRELYDAVARGLVDEGKQVTGIGLVSTPQLHYFQVQGGYDGGVMVTASHNPPEYHGFKLYDSSGGSISYAKGLNRIEALVADLEGEPALSGGSFAEDQQLEGYIDFVATAAGGRTLSKKFVVDVGNGSAGGVFASLAAKLNLDCLILYGEPDGTFPNRNPNPLRAESKKAAGEEVRRISADFGAVLDGDGDRVLFLDEHGEGIENYFVSALIAEELFQEHPGAPVVYDLISSRALPEWIKEKGGKPVVSMVGYTHLYDRMVEEGAVFGSETSGHVYFKVEGRFFTESAAFAVVLLLRLLEKRGQPLSELVKPLQTRYVQSPEVNVEITDKEQALKKVEEHFPGGTINRMDGLSVAFEDFWFNIRPSNTEPLLRLRLEGRTPEVVREKTGEIMDLIGKD